MRWTNRKIVEQFGERDEQTGEVRMKCPTCDNHPEFDTIEQWKDHMQKEHGGFTSSEMEQGQIHPETSSQSSAQPAQAQPERKAPKRQTQRARELNEKSNRCIALILKHIVSGITDTEREEMETLRTNVTEAFIGIEIDFDQQLFSISGKWAILVVIVSMYLLPNIPSMKESIGKAIERAKQKKGQHVDN